jgi:hypothetical protein
LKNLQDSSASLSPAQEEQKTSGNFIFKAALAAVALCLGGAGAPGASVTASAGCDPFSGLLWLTRWTAQICIDWYRLIESHRFWSNMICFWSANCPASFHPQILWPVAGFKVFFSSVMMIPLGYHITNVYILYIPEDRCRLIDQK